MQQFRPITTGDWAAIDRELEKKYFAENRLSCEMF